MALRRPPCGLRPEQKPRGGPLGELAWGIALTLYESCMLGDKAWWWRMHYGLIRAYRGWNPDRTLAELPADKQRDTLAYGETPAYTVTKILQTCREHFPDAESIIDLGAGRGILAMTAAATGWDVLAIEYLKEFVDRSEPITTRLGWPVQWIHGDFMILPLPPSDIIHVAATTYPEATRLALADKFAAECDSEQGILVQDWILDDERFEALVGVRLPVGWGSSYFTLHRPRRHPSGTQKAVEVELE